MTSISPEKWRISLPLFPPGEVTDNSTRTEYIHCMRKGFYKYGMRRSFEGKSFAIQYGLAYHKYREHVEVEMRSRGVKMNDEIHSLAIEEATKDWEDPPLGNRHEHLDLPRLIHACTMAKKRIEQEQMNGQIIVTRSEDSFDLEMPFHVCDRCGWATFKHDKECQTCNGGNQIRLRHGGRVDQFVEFQGSLFIRDWKTTGYKNKHYDKKFDVSSQMQGYVWACSELAGREAKGALIETVYNTKTKGPIITQNYVEYSSGQMQQWLASQMMYEQFIRSAWSRVEELGYLAFPQNTDHCTAMGLCPYHEACQMGSGREIDRWLETSTIYSHWDFMNPDGEAGEI